MRAVSRTGEGRLLSGVEGAGKAEHAWQAGFSSCIRWLKMQRFPTPLCKCPEWHHRLMQVRCYGAAIQNDNWPALPPSASQPSERLKRQTPSLWTERVLLRSMGSEVTAWWLFMEFLVCAPEQSLCRAALGTFSMQNGYRWRAGAWNPAKARVLPKKTRGGGPKPCLERRAVLGGE